MTHPDHILLYVDDAAASGRFYADLLGCEPVDASPGFVLFALSSGLRLGLWTRSGVVPAATAPGGSEIGFQLARDAEVDATHADWQARGVEILSAPERLDFGRSFVARDPDGHRLRVYALAAE